MTSPPGRGHTRRGVVRSHTVIASDAPLPGTGPVRVDMATMLSVDPTVARHGLRTPALRVLALCARGVLSVAEVAVHLDMPGGVVRVLIAELVASGHLLAADPFVPRADEHDVEFLEKVLHGLQRL